MKTSIRHCLLGFFSFEKVFAVMTECISQEQRLVSVNLIFLRDVDPLEVLPGTLEGLFAGNSPTQPVPAASGHGPDHEGKPHVLVAHPQDQNLSTGLSAFAQAGESFNRFCLRLFLGFWHLS